MHIIGPLWNIRNPFGEIYVVFFLFLQIARWEKGKRCAWIYTNADFSIFFHPTLRHCHTCANTGEWPSPAQAIFAWKFTKVEIHANLVHQCFFSPSLAQNRSEREANVNFTHVWPCLFATCWNFILRYQIIVQVKENHMFLEDLWSPDRLLFYFYFLLWWKYIYIFLPVGHSTWATTLWFLILCDTVSIAVIYCDLLPLITLLCLH